MNCNGSYSLSMGCLLVKKLNCNSFPSAHDQLEDPQDSYEFEGQDYKTSITLGCVARASVSDERFFTKQPD